MLAISGQTIDWAVPAAIAAGVLIAAGLVVVIVRAVRARRSDDD